MYENSLKTFTDRYLSDFNPKEPFIWKLRLPYSRFEELEKLVAANPNEALKHPVTTIVYLAEWYKWRYTGQGHQSRVLKLTSEQLRQLYVDAGIDTERYVAVNPETGRHSWLYSIFVLGGLPVQQEVSRSKASGFLRSICSMYHGGNGETTTELADAGRAEAFRKALKPGGALHGFVMELIDGGQPFAPEDADNPKLAIQQFRQMLINANERVRNDKFNIRRVVVCPPDSDRMSRKIELHLLPEITGEGLSQYLMYDRILLWKFPDPQEIEWIEFFVRFMKGNRCIEETKNLATFTNTGIKNRGFVGWNLGDAIIVRDVPCTYFDNVVIVARDNLGREFSVQESKEPDVMQVYHTDNYCEWSDFTNPQRTTAVLWSSPWKVKDCPAGLDSIRRFVNRQKEVRDKMYHFTLIPDELTLLDADDTPTTLYNHQGHDRLVAKGHYDTIAYRENDEVCFIELDDKGNELEEQFLPVIYCKDDLLIIRRSGDEEAEDIEVNPETYEWKSNNQYVEWTDDNSPIPGRVKIRASVRGRLFVKEFVYLGGNVTRELSKHIVTYPGGEAEDTTKDVDTPLTPTITVKISLNHGVCKLDVWRPLNIKEINIGDSNYFRISADTLSVPAIVCDRAWVGLFGGYGYQKYLCRPLTQIYASLSINDKVSRLIDCKTMAAIDFDPSAPDDLNVVMAKEYDQKESIKNWILWDYVGQLRKNNDFTKEVAPNSILFQGRTALVKPLKVYAPVFGSYNAFKYRITAKNVNLIDCFETAALYCQYYFAFLPLRNVTAELFKTEIINKLKDKYGGSLPSELKIEIERAMVELNLKTAEDYEI